MLILDTNVVSALMQEPVHPAVVRWLDHQPRISIWVTAITLTELRHGIECLDTGRRRSRLLRSLERLIEDKLDHRIAAFDAPAANATALLMAQRRRAGRTGDLRDAMIAGTVIACHATLATRNTRHFADLSAPVINPWDAPAQ
jgi:predicted nucleic acid-binding protein